MEKKTILNSIITVLYCFTCLLLAACKDSPPESSIDKNKLDAAPAAQQDTSAPLAEQPKTAAILSFRQVRDAVVGDEFAKARVLLDKRTQQLRTSLEDDGENKVLQTKLEDSVTFGILLKIYLGDTVQAEDDAVMLRQYVASFDVAGLRAGIPLMAEDAQRDREGFGNSLKVDAEKICAKDLRPPK